MKSTRANHTTGRRRYLEPVPVQAERAQAREHENAGVQFSEAVVGHVHVCEGGEAGEGWGEGREAVVGEVEEEEALNRKHWRGDAAQTQAVQEELKGGEREKERRDR